MRANFSHQKSQLGNFYFFYSKNMGDPEDLRLSLSSA